MKKRFITLAVLIATGFNLPAATIKVENKSKKDVSVGLYWGKKWHFKKIKKGKSKRWNSWFKDIVYVNWKILKSGPCYQVFINMPAGHTEGRFKIRDTNGGFHSTRFKDVARFFEHDTSEIRAATFVPTFGIREIVREGTKKYQDLRAREYTCKKGHKK